MAFHACNGNCPICADAEDLAPIRITSDYTVDFTQYNVVFADITSNNITVTFPTGHTTQTQVIVKLVGGNIAINSLIVTTSDGALVEGSPSVTLDDNVESFTFRNDGLDWWIV